MQRPTCAVVAYGANRVEHKMLLGYSIRIHPSVHRAVLRSFSCYPTFSAQLLGTLLYRFRTISYALQYNACPWTYEISAAIFP